MSESAKSVPSQTFIGIPEIVGFITRGLTSVGVPAEDAGQVELLLEHGAGSLLHPDTQLRGDDARESGLAQAGRAVE